MTERTTSKSVGEGTTPGPLTRRGRNGLTALVDGRYFRIPVQSTTFDQPPDVPRHEAWLDRDHQRRDVRRQERRAHPPRAPVRHRPQESPGLQVAPGRS